MKIVIEFDSFEEFEGFRRAPEPVAKKPEQKPEALMTKKQEPVVKKQEPAEQKAPWKQEDAGELRVTVRKKLAELNKLTGVNTAKGLIQNLGVDKLTEVADADLPGLLKIAEEALNG